MDNSVLKYAAYAICCRKAANTSPPSDELAFCLGVSARQLLIRNSCSAHICMCVHVHACTHTSTCGESKARSEESQMPISLVEPIGATSSSKLPLYGFLAIRLGLERAPGILNVILAVIDIRGDQSKSRPLCLL